MEESIEYEYEHDSNKKNDFNNELGKASERYSNILLAKILKKEQDTFFNINFDVIKAIKGIKTKLKERIPLESTIENEFMIYMEIKDLVKICNFLLI